VDSRRIELQLRAIIVTYRIEHRRRDSVTMEGFRERARMLLDSLEDEMTAHPHMRTALNDTRREIERPDSSSRSDDEAATLDGPVSSRPKPAG